MGSLLLEIIYGFHFCRCGLNRTELIEVRIENGCLVFIAENNILVQDSELVWILSFNLVTLSGVLAEAPH